MLTNRQGEQRGTTARVFEETNGRTIYPVKPLRGKGKLAKSIKSRR